MSVVVGDGEELYIPRENCPAAPFVVADYVWLAGQMPLIRRVSSLLL
jgi:hypothetical protein